MLVTKGAILTCVRVAERCFGIAERGPSRIQAQLSVGVNVRGRIEFQYTIESFLFSTWETPVFPRNGGGDGGGGGVRGVRGSSLPGQPTPPAAQPAILLELGIVPTVRAAVASTAPAWIEMPRGAALRKGAATLQHSSVGGRASHPL